MTRYVQISEENFFKKCRFPCFWV